MYIYWYIMIAQIGYRYYPWDLDVEVEYKTTRNEADIVSAKAEKDNDGSGCEMASKHLWSRIGAAAR